MDRALTRDDARPDNLADLVRRAAGRAPDHPALRFRTETISWRVLDERVDALARGLRGLGLLPGERVALLLGNTPDQVATFFAVQRAGLIAVPVNTAYTAEEVHHLLADSGSAVAICNRLSAQVVSGLAEELPALRSIVVTDLPDAPEGQLTLDALLVAGEPVASTGGGEDICLLMYTSGTSGRPRGAMLSHRALLANLEQVARIDPPVITPDDVVLLVLPLFHIYGLSSGLGAVAFHAATGVLVERFDPVGTLEDLRRHDVSVVLGAPPMFVAWSLLPQAAESFHGVRVAVCGAAPLPESAHRALLDQAGRHVFEGYGLTETGPVLTTTLSSEVPKRGSIGRPIPGVELRLVDEAGDEVEDDDPGQIVVRGANLFSGYWPEGRGGPGPDGWFPTGDVAYADDDGDLFLVDRVRELILVSGFNVYPQEVETVLCRHPDIAEAAVIGVPHPYTGESVKAVVRLRPGARLSAEDVIEHAARSLARFKCPTSVRFVDELPHSPTGKVAKGRLRDAERFGDPAARVS